MGERKGTNLYYPPDYDPKKGGLNKFLGTHALRERARKLHMGILIIRFEMPYNIWCEGCNNHIGMGVRYNAEKKKVGMYYSTPIYQFRMKCHLCDNHFEIKTDPANFDYVIVSGARRQENRWDPTQNEQVVPEDKTTSKRLFDDAMFKLEHGDKDQKGAKSLLPTLSKLAAMREDRWQDDYSANCALRQNFRAGKHAQKKIEARDRALTNKFGLDFPLLPETESDMHLAKLLALKPAQSILERQSQSRQAIIERPVLPSSNPNEMRVLMKPLKRARANSDVKKHTSQILVKRRNKETSSEMSVTAAETVKSASKNHYEDTKSEDQNSCTTEVCSISETKLSTRETEDQKLVTSVSTGENNKLATDDVHQLETCSNTHKVISQGGSTNNTSCLLASNVITDKSLVPLRSLDGGENVEQEISSSNCSKSQEFHILSPVKSWVKTFASPSCGSNNEQPTPCVPGDSKDTSLCFTKVTVFPAKAMAVPNTENSLCGPSVGGSSTTVKKQTVCLVDSEYCGSTSSDSEELTSS